MFFYSEKIALTIGSSLNNLVFSSIATNSSSSLSFTVSVASGDATEEVTVSDNSDQFEFSPSSFTLAGEGASQVVTATFKPTASAVKNALITLSAAGGSVKAVSMTGSSTNYNTVVSGTSNAYTMSADRAPGRKPPVGVGSFPTGSTGWYFQNNTTTGAMSSMNWYFYSDSLTNSASLGSLTSGYAIVTMNTHSAVSASHRPYFTVYTYPQPADLAAGRWYQSRLTYQMTASAVPGVKYLMYFGQNPTDVSPELPRINLPLYTGAGTTTFGPRGANEVVYTAALFTSAIVSTPTIMNANVNKCIIVSEGMGYRTSNGSGSWQGVTLQS